MIPTEILLIMLEPFLIVVDISVVGISVASIKVSSFSWAKFEIFSSDKFCASMKQQKVKNVAKYHVILNDPMIMFNKEFSKIAKPKQYVGK